MIEIYTRDASRNYVKDYWNFIAIEGDTMACGDTLCELCDDSFDIASSTVLNNVRRDLKLFSVMESVKTLDGLKDILIIEFPEEFI